jgi:hypothetical protein
MITGCSQALCDRDSFGLSFRVRIDGHASIVMQMTRSNPPGYRVAHSRNGALTFSVHFSVHNSAGGMAGQAALPARVDRAKADIARVASEVGELRS